MQRNKILLHIGYHKTGTTWLQKNLFPSPALGFVSPVSRPDMERYIAFPHDFDFDAEHCRAHFEPIFQEAWAANLTPVLSFERFCGDFYSGAPDNKTMADRLHAIAPEGQVLIVIREQRSALRSHYAQYVHQYGISSVSDYFLLPITQPTRIKFSGFRLEHLQYHRLIQYYMKLFGRENVLVLPYEQFRTDQHSFACKIMDYCGIQGREARLDALPAEAKNVSLSGLALEIKRRLNWVIGERAPQSPWVLYSLPRGHSRLRHWVERLDQRLPEAWKTAANRRLMQQIEGLVDKEYYAESNRITAELTGLDLARYGYEMGVAEHAPTALEARGRTLAAVQDGNVKESL